MLLGPGQTWAYSRCPLVRSPHTIYHIGADTFANSESLSGSVFEPNGRADGEAISVADIHTDGGADDSAADDGQAVVPSNAHTDGGANVDSHADSDRGETPGPLIECDRGKRCFDFDVRLRL